MRLIDADRLKEKVLKWLPSDPCGIEEKEHPIETDIVVSLMMEIEEAPTVGGWIPVSERLPEEFYVLCCDNYGEMIIANPFKCDDSDTGFSAESDECYMYNCIAWMPRPEPYREDGEA